MMPFSLRMLRSSELAAAPLVLMLALAGLAACSRSPAPEARAAEPDTTTSSREPGVAGTVELDDAAQRAVGLGVEPLEAIEVTPEIKAFGRVLDPTPLATLVHDLTAAQAALDASEQELHRSRTLLKENNASERVLQAAQAAAARDRAQMTSLTDRIALGWGAALARRQNLAALIDDLTSLKAQIVRLNLPLGEALPAPPAAARLAHLTGETLSTQAELLGPAPSTDPQLQTQGLLYLVRASTMPLTPDSAVVGYLPLTGAPPLRGVRLPSSAVVRHEAGAWVYVQKDAAQFERVLLSSLQPIDGGWLVPQDLKPGERVVTSGAQILLSEELKAQVRLED